MIRSRPTYIYTDSNCFLLKSLVSFLRNLHLHHVKKSAPKVKAMLKSIVKRYCDGQSIIALASQMNYPPYLLSRFIVEEVSLKGGNKKSLAKTMKDPRTFLKDRSDIKEKYAFSESSEDPKLLYTRLATEVIKAIECDPMYGPPHDRQRHLIGIEYEVLLEYQLNDLSE